ncbi:helicase C-terminal domain-containing protein [Methanobacterium alcaliphilum]|uniref:helicase C-terminal domain-containing protein n=1 Tax=Methanobacterium alcaliphilum TaxID=392018 RepID=UPI00200A39F0|nr:ATP-dependent DNA helicase [Methanobacterium alcaliphilum]MCK9151067.1 ATP-dependent DNA helicase [Methanobacterium alcaliphilum]
MANPLFCPNCGMMKSRCICGPDDDIRKDTSLFEAKFLSRRKNKKNDDNISRPTVLSPSRRREIKNKFPHIEDDIIESFPFPNPREGQLDIISDIYNAIEEGYKYIVLEAGTGTGKSPIATTLARIYNPAYILTMTKQLQAQYANEFDFPLVKGRGNFQCKHDDLESGCDIGTCQTTPRNRPFNCSYGVSKAPTLGNTEAFTDSYGNSIFYQSNDHCHYWNQKADAVNGDITLMNYDYALLELNYVGHFGKRELMILDEAHNIEDKLMKRLEVNIFNQRLKKDLNTVLSKELISSPDPQDWIMQVEAVYKGYKELNLKDLPKNKADRVNRTVSRLEDLTDKLEKEPKNWVVDFNQEEVSFKPLRVHQYAHEHLFRHAETCIFMSATILSHQMFCKWLGLDPKEVYFVKVDSPFPASKRPIEFKLAGKMSKNRIKRTAPDTLPILNKILKRHKHDKGLIHTHNYQCQKYLMEKVPNSRLVGHNSANRESVLYHFEASRNPLVLVSPSMSEGVDLPYDQCRFQVIYKVPFPYLGDRQVNLRRQRDQRWYAYKTVMTLMQAYGRGMRAHDDECYTYVLDENIKMLFKSPLYRSLVPQFFKEAVIEED